MTMRNLGLLLGALGAVLAAAAPAAAGTTYTYVIDPFSQNIGDVVSESGPSPVSHDTGDFATAPNAGGLHGIARARVRADATGVGVYGAQGTSTGFGLSSGNAVESFARVLIDDVVVTGAGSTVDLVMGLLLDGSFGGAAGTAGLENSGNAVSRIDVGLRIGSAVFQGSASVEAWYAEGRFPVVGSSVSGADFGLLDGILPGVIPAHPTAGRPASYSLGLASTVWSPTVTVPVGTPFTVSFELRSWTGAGAGGTTAYAVTDFLNSLSIPGNGLLTLPDGYSAASATFGDLTARAPATNAVPLPAGAALGGLGLALLAAFRRRR